MQVNQQFTGVFGRVRWCNMTVPFCSCAVAALATGHWHPAQDFVCLCILFFFIHSLSDFYTCPIDLGILQPMNHDFQGKAPACLPLVFFVSVCF
jgi:hypothetical protein